MASLPEPSGSEPGYRRPCLIISANSFNVSRISTVIAAVITPNLRLADAPGNVRLPVRGTGLSKPSVVNADHHGRQGVSHGEDRTNPAESIGFGR
ncbi:MAG: type II toxin-antitoxin system PemK/MazF family toxin [Burkholderiales bacterium]